MKAVKGSNKNSASLRKHTHLNATVPNETRWNGNHSMMNSAIKMKPALEEAQKEDDADFELPSATENEMNTTYKCLKDVNQISKGLQRRHIQVNDCRALLNRLVQAAQVSNIHFPHTYIYLD